MKQVAIGERTTPVELAALLGLPEASVIEAGIHALCRLLTTNDVLNFDEAADIAVRYGFTVRRKRR
jgi:hypothetical protein